METKFLYTSQNQVINERHLMKMGKENGIIPDA